MPKAAIWAAIILALGTIIGAVIGLQGCNCPSLEDDTFALRIGSPSSCQDSGLEIDVSGTSSGKKADDKFAWIIVGPRSSPGDWYPQGKDHLSFNEQGEWNTMARIGGDEEGDIGKKFDIRAVLVDQRTDDQYLQWINEGNKTGYPPLRIPNNARTLDQVTVVRTYMN